MSIGNDPRPGRPRTSTDERSVKLVADALEEDCHATCEELSTATGAKTSQENVQELVAGPLFLLDNARPHIADVCVCSNANPLHYYMLRVPLKADRWH